MTIELLIALIGFIFIGSVTPGPNNIMLMSSGTNFGFLRTLPHMLGIEFGTWFLVLTVGLGLGKLFEAYPDVRLIMKACSTVYLLYLAWKIANAVPPKEGDPEGKPFSFLQAAGFQWVNPKLWSVSIYTVTNFSPPGEGFVPALIVATVFVAVNLPAISIWVMIGTQIRKLLSQPRRLTIFNWVMASLLVLTLIPVWFSSA
jgi:threonine/homoserine/homoserine lactone efflux protein